MSGKKLMLELESIGFKCPNNRGWSEATFSNGKRESTSHWPGVGGAGEHIPKLSLESSPVEWRPFIKKGKLPPALLTHHPMNHIKGNMMVRKWHSDNDAIMRGEKAGKIEKVECNIPAFAWLFLLCLDLIPFPYESLLTADIADLPEYRLVKGKIFSSNNNFPHLQTLQWPYTKKTKVEYRWPVTTDLSTIAYLIQRREFFNKK